MSGHMDNSNTDGLPPLPESCDSDSKYDYFGRPYRFTDRDMYEYARAHAAALQAENDKLRADAERWSCVRALNPTAICAIAWSVQEACAFSSPDEAVDAARAAITGDEG